MDKTGDFYSLDMGSIPVRRAKIFVDKYSSLSYNKNTSFTLLTLEKVGDCQYHNGRVVVDGLSGHPKSP